MSPDNAAFVRQTLSSISPAMVMGAFKLSTGDISSAPATTRTNLERFVDWTVIVFGLPITDQTLWVWHKTGERRFLFANFLLSEASKALNRALAGAGETCVDVVDVFGQELSMTELGVRAGLGTRGLNNLLLHPTYGAWMQLHAVFSRIDIPAAERLTESVCISCRSCFDACPAHALADGEFRAEACRVLVAAPWYAKSKAVALAENSYIECAECIRVCPIGRRPEGIFEWRH